MRVGEKIRLVRESKKMTSEEIADLLGMSVGNYLKIERGEVDINTDKIERISNLLGLKPHELLIEDKITLNFSNNDFSKGGYGMYAYNTINFSEELKKLYIDKITLLEERVKYLEDKIKNFDDHK